MEDYWQDIENILVKHRARQALRNLMAAGPLATPVVRRGLHHPDATIRYHCCRILDHFLDDNALPDLIGRLEDEDERVRAAALRTLACDRCKEGECRPAEAEVFPIVMKMLVEDPSTEVRGAAVTLLFTAVHRREDAREAIEHARDFDPSASIRRKASMRAPGGVMFMRTSPNGRIAEASEQATVGRI